MKYSVLTYNFNHYECMREIPRSALCDNIEYIYVTDDDSLKSTSWNVIYDRDLIELSPFEKVFAVRYNPFKYVNTDIVLKIDGSIQVTHNLIPFLDAFNKSLALLGIMLHPDRTTIFDEYMAWIMLRNYPKEQAFFKMALMQKDGYDIKANNGLYQLNVSIERKCNLVESLNSNCLMLCKTNLNHVPIDRLDQTIYSYLVNTKYADIPLFKFNSSVTNGNPMQWCVHNTNMPIKSKMSYSSYCRGNLVTVDF